MSDLKQAGQYLCPEPVIVMTHSTVDCAIGDECNLDGITCQLISNAPTFSSFTLRCQIDDTTTVRARSVKFSITVPTTSFTAEKYINLDTTQTFANTAPFNPLTLVFGDTSSVPASLSG